MTKSPQLINTTRNSDGEAIITLRAPAKRLLRGAWDVLRVLGMEAQEGSDLQVCLKDIAQQLHLVESSCESGKLDQLPIYVERRHGDRPCKVTTHPSPEGSGEVFPPTV